MSNFDKKLLFPFHDIEFMRPHLFHIERHSSQSWRFIDYICDYPVTNAKCDWHFHAEFEIVVYRDPHNIWDGKLVAGDKVCNKHHNAIFLFGPGLPHMTSWQANASRERPCSTHVLWLNQQWLESLATNEPSLSILSQLLDRAKYGLGFSKEIGEEVFNLMDEAEHLPPHQQFCRVITILLKLAEEEDRFRLSSTPFQFVVDSDDDKKDKIRKAQRYIEHYYTDPLPISALCHHLHMSESSVYRLFEQHFGESFATYLKRFRIGKACELLVTTQLPISVVAGQTGFANMSNFNRQFKESKGMTPSAFRQLFIMQPLAKNSQRTITR